MPPRHNDPEFVSRFGDALLRHVAEEFRTDSYAHFVSITPSSFISEYMDYLLFHPDLPGLQAKLERQEYPADLMNILAKTVGIPRVIDAQVLSEGPDDAPVLTNDVAESEVAPGASGKFLGESPATEATADLADIFVHSQAETDVTASFGVRPGDCSAVEMSVYLGPDTTPPHGTGEISVDGEFSPAVPVFELRTGDRGTWAGYVGNNHVVVGKSPTYVSGVVQGIWDGDPRGIPDTVGVFEVLSDGKGIIPCTNRDSCRLAARLPPDKVPSGYKEFILANNRPLKLAPYQPNKESFIVAAHAAYGPPRNARFPFPFLGDDESEGE